MSYLVYAVSITSIELATLYPLLTILLLLALTGLCLTNKFTNPSIYNMAEGISINPVWNLKGILNGMEEIFTQGSGLNNDISIE